MILYVYIYKYIYIYIYYIYIYIKSINQSKQIFLCLRKKSTLYSYTVINSYYSAFINLNLHICDKLSHKFTDLKYTHIHLYIIASSSLITIFNAYKI